MQTRSTFTDAGWDFVFEMANGTDDVWVMRDYPVFAWQYALTGSGTAADPYLIANMDDFTIFCNNSGYWLSGIYARLECDLDLGGITYTQAPIAGDTDTDAVFDGTQYQGHFDGGEHVIRNLTVNCIVHAGLFGYTGEDCSVLNLGLENVAVSADYYVGGLCGSNYRGNISQCYVTGAIMGDDIVGGLCGFSCGSINQCYSAGTVTGDESVGGLCGLNPGSINQCFSTSAITGGIWRVGGLCGWNSGSISQCYSTGAVPDRANYFGGLCGNSTNGSISGCFWDMETSGITTSEGGTGLTTVQMQTRSTFTDAGWDFVFETANGTDDVWAMYDYPVFARQYTMAGSGTAADPYVIDSRAKFDLYIAEPAYWSAYVRLDCHLDLSDTAYAAALIAPDTSAAAGFQGIKFTGNFNGNRRRITGLNINQSAKNYIGLFGCIDSGAQVYDIDVRGSLNGQMYVGGLCGYNTGLIQRCSAGGTVIGNGYVGGLIGFNAGDIRTSCCKSQVDGYDYVGGFAGENHYYGGSIVNSYAVGEMLSMDLGAGFVGLNGGLIHNCYAAVNHPIGGLLVGAFCGAQDTANPGYFSITGCYYDSSTGADLYATAVRPAQLTMRQTFVGWDFTGSIKDGTQNLWHMPFWTNKSRPILSWQIDISDMMRNWMTAETSCDLNGDQTVNLFDFAIHAAD